MWFQTKSALKYYLCSRHGKGHAIHSPFVFNLIMDVFRDKQHYSEYKIIEQQIKQLKKSKIVLKTPIYGAKPSLEPVPVKISNVAKKSVITSKYGELLFRMVRYFKSKNILELGSCLGVGTSYMALANKNAHVWSIEASKKYVEIAQETINKCGICNTDIIHGTFEDKLNSIIEKMPSLDLVFIDGNHTYNATIIYFNQLLKKINNNSVLILDDIYWSKEMNEAWKEIQNNENVTLTIDVHRMGFIFFKKEIMAKQHFVIRF